MKGYPKWFSSTLISLLMGLLLLSAILLIPTTIEMRLEVEMPWRLDSGHRILWAAAHALMGNVLMILLGSLISVHMRLEWRKKQNRKSGLFMVGLFFILILTAVGIYYLGDETMSQWASLIHVGAGLLLVLGYGLHLYRARAVH